MDPPVDNSEGSLGDSRITGSWTTDAVSKIDEVMDTLETVEMDDGVLVRVVAPCSGDTDDDESVSTGVGAETDDGVTTDVIGEEEGVSDKGVGLVRLSDG
jgi:hypothetical protein